MKEYLIHLAQAYPKFRKAELESLADLYNIKLDLSHHNERNPFMIVNLESDEEASCLIDRAVLSKGIYELWGQGTTLEELHEDVKIRSTNYAREYENKSFKFEFIGYKGKKNKKEKVKIIETFSYLGFKGPIKMTHPDEIYSVLEEYEVSGQDKATEPIKMWFGRRIKLSARSLNILDTYDLRVRKYIGTTSFEAELSLVSCNIGQVGPGKVVYDPFTGTGSFLVSAAHYGAITMGSDIDVRALKGKGPECSIYGNLKQYGISLNFLDLLAMDFTNNAIRKTFKIDSIICDPPYGVREGLKVCGTRDPQKAIEREQVIINGEKAHLRRDFIAPKKPYELADLLQDLLSFAAERLPINGRLAFWMPTANDNYKVNQVPQHENLELLYNLEQEFNKWSRRLLVYVKRDISFQGETRNGLKEVHTKSFRERYFKSFNDSGV
ncbi:uncharacterized protein PRCAT00001845001 [Priceomyces carsonii]|uniref:uncharacterized protein n=1 Tax=Priceomyces carsonii TaxID=28549 RepID=UPI002ED806B1|nr:unnamed protein product [Priceomyces carsonii]